MIHVEQVSRQKEKVGGEGEARTDGKEEREYETMIHVEQASRQEDTAGGEGKGSWSYGMGFTFKGWGHQGAVVETFE